MDDILLKIGLSQEEVYQAEADRITFESGQINFVDLHEGQLTIVNNAKRYNVVACGRRFGKTVLGIDRIVRKPLEGFPAAWFAPTYKMMLEVWREVARMTKPIATKQNASEFRIELNTGGVIEFWSLDNPDAARGRKYAEVVVDEAAMIRHLEEAWINVLLPTLIDYSGSAWFLSTPRGPNFYQELFSWGSSESRPDWAAWQMPTWANPHIKAAEIEAMREQMTPIAFQQEIEAKFLDDVEGALWSQELINSLRVTKHPPLRKIVTAIDPASSSGGETGIITAGVGYTPRKADGSGGKLHGYLLSDDTSSGLPEEWTQAAVAAHHKHDADYIVYETNQGGLMVASAINVQDPSIVAKGVHASKGKIARAEPISILYSQGLIHHVGRFPELESQMTRYTGAKGEKSPDRLDAMVWAFVELFGQFKKKKTKQKQIRRVPMQPPRIIGTGRR